MRSPFASTPLSRRLPLVLVSLGLFVLVAACDDRAPRGTTGEGGQGGDAVTTGSVAGPMAVSSSAQAAATSSGGESTGGGGGSDAGAGGSGGGPEDAGHHTLLVNVVFVCDAWDGRVRCWGSNDAGRLGVGDDEGIHPPTWLALEGEVIHLTGQQPSYALLADGTVWHWGGPPLPAPFPGVSEVADVASSYAAYVALSDGSVLAWGPGHRGQLGLGDDTGREEPTLVDGLSDIVDVAAGYDFACARSGHDDLACWGANDSGQVGDGTQEDRWIPTPAFGGVRDVSLGFKHTCAVFDDAAVRCWGSNNFGQVGDGTISYLALEPVEVTLPGGARQVTTGSAHSCALLLSGHVQCWGDDGRGQLGRGSVGGSDRAPAAVMGLDAVVALAASGETTCARRADGSVWCWGANGQGQLADGTTEDRGEPVRVPDGAVGDRDSASPRASRDHGAMASDTRSGDEVVRGVTHSARATRGGAPNGGR